MEQASFWATADYGERSGRSPRSAWPWAGGSRSRRATAPRSDEDGPAATQVEHDVAIDRARVRAGIVPAHEGEPSFEVITAASGAVRPGHVLVLSARARRRRTGPERADRDRLRRRRVQRRVMGEDGDEDGGGLGDRRVRDARRAVMVLDRSDGSRQHIDAVSNRTGLVSRRFEPRRARRATSWARASSRQGSRCCWSSRQERCRKARRGEGAAACWHRATSRNSTIGTSGLEMGDAGRVPGGEPMRYRCAGGPGVTCTHRGWPSAGGRSNRGQGRGVVAGVIRGAAAAPSVETRIVEARWQRPIARPGA